MSLFFTFFSFIKQTALKNRLSKEEEEEEEDNKMSFSDNDNDDDNSTELTLSLSPSDSSSLSSFEEEKKKTKTSPTTTLASFEENTTTREKEERERERRTNDERATMETRVVRLERALLEQENENRSLRRRVERLEKEEEKEETKMKNTDLLELFSTRLANVKDTLREETKRAMDAANGANAKVVQLLETLEACETDDGVVLYRNVVVSGGGGDKMIDRSDTEDEEERKKKRFEYVKEALDQIAEEVGYEDALVLAARGAESGTRSAVAKTFSSVTEKRNGKYYRWGKLLLMVLVKAFQLWVIAWIIIVAAVLADDITLRENVSGDFWSKFPWVSKGIVNFVGLASL